MKKLLIILWLGLLLTGCGTRTTTIRSDFEDPGLKPTKATHFTYKEHDYIQFQWSFDGYDTKAGYVHDPDCRKCRGENRELE